MNGIDPKHDSLARNGINPKNDFQIEDLPLLG